LLEAGETLESALALAADEVDDRRLGDLLKSVLGQVRGGASLSEALAAEPSMFPRAYVGMVRAAEATGRLGPVLKELAELRECQAALQRQLTSSLVYPAILMVTALGAIAVLFLFVVPQFEPVFAGVEDRVPALTVAIMQTSAWLRGHGSTMIVILALTALVLLLARRVPGLRLAFDRSALRMPGLRSIARERATAEIGRGLSTLLKGGLDLPQALSMLREMVSNLSVGEAIDRAGIEVRQGRRLHEALGRERILHPMGQKLLRTAEESGRLEPLCRYIGERFEERIASRMQRVVALLEPVLVIGLGGIVGGIVIAILTAVLSINELAF
jgi:general secretion pathway protein F